ncbi:MAG: hypothetical protein M1840_004177 [Geoglossum simile]|nr:MAG: hypothetical protein M1840_004177 [Geoglossum simile]
MTHWVLVDTPHLPGGERRVLASCETIRKRALVAYQTTEGVKVEEAVSHGIGSVFCPKEYRGRGYAGRMMRELSKLLRDWQVEGAAKRGMCLFTVLYSDIGKVRSFYARLGWHPFASSHISLPPLSKDFVDMASVLPPSRELYAASLKGLCIADERLLRHKLATVSAIKRVHVAFIPDLKSMEYHHAREEFISREVSGCEPSVKGAIVGEAEGQRAWCIWTRVYGSKDTTLYILRFVFEDEATEGASLAHPTEGARPTNGMPSEVKSKQVDAAASLLLAAQREASRWGMKDIQIWNPEPVTLLASQRVLNLTSRVAEISGIEVVDREKESIASLRWYGASQQSELQGLQWGDIEWIGNEKYAWC